MDETSVNKIEEIFSQYINKKNAKIWNIGTDIYRTWQRLNNNLLKYNLSNITEIQILQTINPNKNHKYENNPTKYGIIYANGKNITPKLGNNHWSESGIRQFLQVGSAMNIIMYDENSSVFGRFDVAAEFNDICKNLNESWWLNKISNLILHSLISNQKHINNLGFSIYFALLCKLVPDVFKGFHENYQMSYKVQRKKTPSSWYTKSDKCIQQGIRIYSEKNTYKGLVDVILNNNNNEKLLLSIIDNIYSIIINDDEKQLFNWNDHTPKELSESERKLSELERQCRNKFRNNVLHNRSIKDDQGIINTDLLDNHGSPIQSIKETIEAAHIYEVKKIKEDLGFNQKNNSSNDINLQQQFKDDMINPKNGLLLSSNLHKAFDRHVFNFNIYGEVIYNKENLEKIKLLGIEHAQINPEILNNEMIKFIIKR